MNSKTYSLVGTVFVAIILYFVFDSNAKDTNSFILIGSKFSEFKTQLNDNYTTTESAEGRITYSFLGENNNLTLIAVKDDIIEVIEVYNVFNNPVDAFDLLCHVAFDLKPLTRKQRADLLLKNKPDLFTKFSDGAKEIIEIIISKYIDFGLDQLKPEIIQVEPISSRGNIIEIAEEFGGIDKFKTLIEELQKYLYAA